MSSSALAASIRHLRRKLAGQQPTQDSDEQLLHAFTSRHEENAFAVLVRRHGPMVLHVCRRVLGHEQDAEDAFQATFLVLARNAASLRNKSSLTSFLHGIAYRTAMKTKQSAARRRRHEERTSPPAPANPADELLWREVRALLDEEIARLPERYRSVFILCCLEGLSQAEAGRRLGLKQRTVSNRLTEARKRLAQRLARRGVELTAVLAAATLATQPASAMSPLLISTTIKAALYGGTAGVVSASVAELAKSAASAIMLSRLKVAAAVLLAMGLLGGASVYVTNSFFFSPQGQTETPLPKSGDSEKSAVAPDSAKQNTTQTIEIHGRVLDPDGKPKSRAKLLLEMKGNLTKLGTTAADGRFTATIARKATNYHNFSCLIAQAEDAALDIFDLYQCKGEKPIELRLVKDHPIRGRIVNTEGNPVGGVRVAVQSIDFPTESSLDSFLIAWKKRSFGSSIGSKKRFGTEGETPIATTTNADGRFTIRGVGVERLVSLRLSGAGIAEEELSIVNREGFDPEPYNQAARDSIPKGGKPYSGWFLHGPNVSVVAEAEKPIRGVVTDADSGKPLPNIRVRGVNQTAKTDAENRYEIHGVRKAKSYSIEIASDPSTGYMATHIRVADTTGYQPIRADLRIKKGVIITGKIIDQTTGKSVPGYAAAAVLVNNPFVKEYPEMSSYSLHGDREYTDGDGPFRIVTLPGPVLLMVAFDHQQSTGNFAEHAKYDDPLPDPKHPQYFTKDRNYLRYQAFGGGGAPAVQGEFCKVLAIKPGTSIVHQDAVLRRAHGLAVKIEDAQGQPVSGAWTTGIRSDYPPVQLAEDSCSAYGVKSDKPRQMVVFHTQRKIAGTLMLTGNEKHPVTVRLRPMGAVKGRLLDLDGKPLVGIVVDLRYREPGGFWVHEYIYSQKQILTDAAGAFTLDELVPELKFQLSFQRRKQRFERGTKPDDPYVAVKSGECRDLGAIRLKLLPDADYK